MNGDDLLWAMGTLGFEDYLEPLKVYLLKYRELEGEKGTLAKQGEVQGLAIGVGLAKDVRILGGSSSSPSASSSSVLQSMHKPIQYMYPNQ